MSESFNFELRLVSNIEEKANRGAQALKGVQSQGQKAQKSLDWGKVLGGQLEKVGFASARAAKKQQDAFAASWAKIGMAAERAAQREQRAFERAAQREKHMRERLAEKAKEHSFLSGIKEGTGFGKMTSAAFLGSALSEGMIEGARKFVDVVTDGVRDAFKAVAGEQRFRIGETLSLGRMGGRAFREDAERMGKLTGIDPDMVRGMLLGTRRAGYGESSARQQFATATDIAAGLGRGGDSGVIGEVLETFKTLKAKGGIGDKRLAELLGNTGDTLPQFYKNLGKRLGIGSDAAKQRLAEGGKIDPQLVINAITEAVNKKQGGGAGTGGLAYGRSFDARIGQLERLPEEYLKKLVESPEFDKIDARMAGLLDRLDPDSPNGRKIFAALERSFDKLLTSAEHALTPENINKFADGIGKALDGLAKLPEYLDKIVTASEVLGTIWAGSKLIGGVTTLAELLPGIGTAAGAATAAIGTMAAPLLAVGAAAASVGVAVARIQNTADELGGWKRVGKDFKDWISGEKPAEATGLGAPKGMHWDPTINGYRPDSPILTDHPAVASTGKPAVQMTNHIQINIHGQPGDDDKHREAAEKLHDHLVNQLGRAARSAG